MKRSTRSVTAFLLTLLLIIASPVAAFAATESGSISGDSTVDTVIINVVLPTELDFALDPLGLDVTGDSQIATANYFFVNQTFAPVRVELAVTATTTNDAELVSTTSAITGQSDPSVTDKLIYFGALGATELSTTITATDAAIATTDSSISYPAYFGGDNAPTGVYPTGTAVSSTLVPAVPETGGTTGSAVIGFALAAANESSTTEGAIESLAANNDGVAAFQFYGQLNTYADWQAGDVSVTGAYTLVPLRGETYDTYHAEEIGLNQYVVATPEPEEPAAPYGGVAGFIVGDATSTTRASINISKASTADITIPFYFGDPAQTITSLNLNGTFVIPASAYTTGTDTLVLVKNGSAAVDKTVFDSASNGTKNVIITLSSGSTFTLSVVIAD